MRDVRARALPYVGDDLGGSERQEGAETRGDDSMAPVDRAPLPAREEDHGQQGNEEHLCLHGEESQRILRAVMVRGEPVDDLESLEVDAGSVGTGESRTALAGLTGGSHDDLVHAHVSRARHRVNDLRGDVLRLQHLADLLA
jgi:hypothetical protein